MNIWRVATFYKKPILYTPHTFGGICDWHIDVKLVEMAMWCTNNRAKTNDAIKIKSSTCSKQMSTAHGNHQIDLEMSEQISQIIYFILLVCRMHSWPKSVLLWPTVHLMTRLIFLFYFPAMFRQFQSESAFFMHGFCNELTPFISENGCERISITTFSQMNGLLIIIII